MNSKTAMSGGSNAQGHELLVQVFTHHNRELLGFLAHRLGNDAEAREVAQDAYLRLLQADKPGEVSFLRAYLFKVAANLAVDRMRRRGLARKFEPPVEAESLQDEIDPLRQLSCRQELSTLQKSLRELPEAFRQAFVLRRVERKSASEVCEHLGIGERQLRERVKRATIYCRLRLDGFSAAVAKEQLK